MLTPYVLSSRGSSAVLIAQSTSVISQSQVNWYFKGNAITVNGIVSQQNGKYVASSNGTIFTLTIQALQGNDFGSYSLLYLNLQTIQVTVVNATLQEIGNPCSLLLFFSFKLSNFSINYIYYYYFSILAMQKFKHNNCCMCFARDWIYNARFNRNYVLSGSETRSQK